MIIQNEYCNGGSLADQIAQEALSSSELRRLVLHVAEGLRYIHSEGLVHLDIKPGNIFISKEKRLQFTNYDSADDGFEDIDEQTMNEEEFTYKIGDLGHVTSLNNPQVSFFFVFSPCFFCFSIEFCFCRWKKAIVVICRRKSSTKITAI